MIACYLCKCPIVESSNVAKHLCVGNIKVATSWLSALFSPSKLITLITRQFCNSGPYPNKTLVSLYKSSNWFFGFHKGWGGGLNLVHIVLFWAGALPPYIKSNGTKVWGNCDTILLNWFASKCFCFRSIFDFQGTRIVCSTTPYCAAANLHF